jgi:shikimate dehydrogenase
VAKKRHPARLVLLGSPVSNSLSPVLQGAALAAAGIRLSYEALDVEPDRLEKVIQELKSSRGAGNVTRPHKVAVHDACDTLTPIARRVAAVNTFWVEEGQLHGDNTDVEGFDAAARSLLRNDTSALDVVLLGAGGGAAAVLAALEHWPRARVTIISRNPERAALLARRYPDVARVETDAYRAVAGTRLIVNATPVGQHDDLHPLEVSAIPRDAAVIDLVYRKGGTPWIKALREKGNPAQDGMPMLLEQGALSFRRWFGIEPDREAMRRALL